MIDANLYIACLVLSERPCLVVGEGAMADEKVAGLEACGASVTRATSFEPSDLNGKFLVVAAVDRELGERIFEEAERRAILCNVVDIPELCNFILPAITREGPLAVAISTSGASPALAKRMKREMDLEPYARLAVLLDEVRDWTKRNLSTYEDRKEFFESIVNGEPDPVELIRQGREQEVRELIEAAKATRRA